MILNCFFNGMQRGPIVDGRAFSHNFFGRPKSNLSGPKIVGFSCSTMDAEKRRDDLFAELRAFLRQTRHPVDVQTDRISLSAKLLKTLPAAKDAVLEYYEKLFDYGVVTYLKNIKNKPLLSESSNTSSCSEMSTNLRVVIDNLNHVRDGLLKLVEEDHSLWAPVIMLWSNNLLEKVSKHYNALDFPRQPLGEMLRFWYQCPAAYVLVDTFNKTITKMVNTDGEESVNDVIETMLRYRSSSFEWVVAKISTHFPLLVIKNLLLSGIKELCTTKRFKRTEKLNSSIRIFDFISIIHFNNIKDVVFEFFELSFGEHPQKFGVDNISVVPYLLHMSLYSSTILKSMLCDNITKITPEVLNKLLPLYPLWKKYFNEHCGMLITMVQVLLNADRGIDYVINLLFQLIDCDDPELKSLKNSAKSFLDLFLDEFESSLRTNQTTPPVLKALFVKLHFIEPSLLSSNVDVAQPASRLLSCIAIRDQECLLPYISTMLIKCKSSTQIETLIEVLSYGLNMTQFDVGLVLTLNKTDVSLANVWNNVNTLLSLESNPPKGVSLKGVSLSVISHLEKICRLMIECCQNGEMYSAHLLSSILSRVSAKLSVTDLSVSKVIYCVKAAVIYFFTCLYKEKDEVFKLKVCVRISEFVNTICSRWSVARNAAMKNIMDGILKEPFSLLFVMPEHRRDDYVIKQPEIPLLLGSLHRQDSSSKLSDEMSIKFDPNEPHSKYDTPVFNAETVRFNEQRLVSFLHSCYSSNEDSSSPDQTLNTVISLALLVVQIVSPDVMYNGLPWPDDEFAQVTIERDVHIYRKITSKPILWTILGILASHRPAVCYCSVILRAVCACLINHWGTVHHAGGNSKDNKQLLDNTVKLLNTMSLGQLLPKPLDVLGVIVPDFTPKQILIVLRDCVWTYTKDHIPAPDLFLGNNIGGMWRDMSVAVPMQYSDTLRFSMMENISELGDLFARLFNDKEPNTENNCIE